MNSAWPMDSKKIAQLLAYRGKYGLAAGIACLAFSALVTQPCTAQIAVPDEDLMNLPEMLPPVSTDRPKSNRKPRIEEDVRGTQTTPTEDTASSDSDANSATKLPVDAQKKPATDQESSNSRPTNFDTYVDASLSLSRTKLGAKDGVVQSENPSVMMSTWIRGTTPQKRFNASAWAGLRLASFSGHLINDIDSIRYNFTYIGPGLALGRLYTKSNSNPKSLEDDVVSGLFLKFGVAGVSRRTTSHHSNEWSTIKTAPLTTDGCGCWAEINWIKGLDSSLSLTTHVGVQSGSKKSIIYAGMGSLLWL